MKIVVLAGAGASKAVNSKEYLTTVDYFERIREKIDTHKSSNISVSYLKNNHMNVDIEEVLFLMGHIKKHCTSVSGDPRLVYFYKRLGEFQPRNHQPANIDGSGILDQLINDITVATKMLNEDIHKLYGRQPTSGEIASNWTLLFSALRNYCNEETIDVFTTNYDLVIDYALDEYCRNHGTKVYLGHEFIGIFTGLTMKDWAKNTSQFEFTLTKLHGSVDWKEKKKRIYVKQEIDTTDDNCKLILLGYKDQPDEYPYDMFHEYFRKKIQNADLIITIGFAFRDDALNKILSEQPIADWFIDVDLNPQKTFDVKMPSHIISCGFNETAVNDIANYLSTLSSPQTLHPEKRPAF